MSKTDKMRRLARKRTARANQREPRDKPAPDTAPRDKAIRPTAERMAHGRIVIAARDAPAVDTEPDMIGRLAARGDLTQAQLEAGRRFQEARAAFRADLPIAGYRSCLATGEGGYDGGDGDQAAARDWARIKERLGLTKFLILLSETEKPWGGKPASLPILCAALDRMGC